MKLCSFVRKSCNLTKDMLRVIHVHWRIIFYFRVVFSSQLKDFAFIPSSILVTSFSVKLLFRYRKRISKKLRSNRVLQCLIILFLLQPSMDNSSLLHFSQETKLMRKYSQLWIKKLIKLCMSLNKSNKQQFNKNLLLKRMMTSKIKFCKNV